MKAPKRPTSITIECRKCGGDIEIPLVISAPYYTPEGEVAQLAYSDVFADVDRAQHTCTRSKRPKGAKRPASKR